MSGLPTEYQSFIHLSRYARWDYDKERRETWNETVARYFNFFEEHINEECGYTLKKEERKELEQAVQDKSEKEIGNRPKAGRFIFYIGLWAIGLPGNLRFPCIFQAFWSARSWIWPIHFFT